MIGFNVFMIYVVDSYVMFVVSVLVVVLVLCVVCVFVFLLWVFYLYDVLGNGWGNSVLVFIVIVIGGLVFILLWYYGVDLCVCLRFCVE